MQLSGTGLSEVGGLTVFILCQNCCGFATRLCVAVCQFTAAKASCIRQKAPQLRMAVTMCFLYVSGKASKNYVRKSLPRDCDSQNKFDTLYQVQDTKKRNAEWKWRRYWLSIPPHPRMQEKT